MIGNDQQRASISSYADLARNPDGSTDLHFGPAAPPGAESNWVQTIPGQGFFVMFRLYGLLEAVFDGTWELGDLQPHAAPHADQPT